MVFATENHFLHAARPILAKRTRGGGAFKTLFGASPAVCALTWNLFDLAADANLHFKHLLWGLLFLKTYGKANMLAAMVGCHRETFMKWTWHVVKKIAGLKPRVVRRILLNHCAFACACDFATCLLTLEQIKLSNRFRRDRGRTCKLTVDGTDCQINEPHPFSKSWYSHKHKSAGLRYEVAVCIQTGDICWVNGPFKCGSWPDLKIFRRDLKHRLVAGEMVECDGGYRGDPKCRHKDVIFNRSDLGAKKAARARHETVNGDIKKFDCLKQTWRHDRKLHKHAFAAAAVLTQLSYSIGKGPTFEVNY
jgi:hypothetical protein